MLVTFFVYITCVHRSFNDSLRKQAVVFKRGSPFAPLMDPVTKPACPLLRETGGLCYADLLLKLLRHILQQLSDGQVLGADTLALAAADAVRGAGAGPGVDILIVVVRVPVVVGVLRVHDGKQVVDGDMLRAAFGAVAAGRAGDQVLFMEDLLHPVHGGQLGIVQRRKVLHVAQVVLHLLHAAHAGQHHQHTGEARGKPDGIAGGAAAVQGVQHGFCVVGQVDKAAALDRLHDQHGLAMPAADLIALAALDGHVVIVQIIELDLHDLDGRIVGQNLLQHGGAVMERDAHMADLALGLEGEGRLIGAAVPEVLVVCRALGVH